MSARDKLIALALGEEGYLEKASSSQLDIKTANAGHGNYTKYARDMDAIEGFYNGKKQGFPWCSVFIAWCFVQCFGVEKAMRLLCQEEYSAGAGCTYAAQYFQSRGQLHFKDPQPGDQIFFGTAADCYHIGIVYKVDNDNVYTIEGNTSSAPGVDANGGAVCRKVYSKNYGRIYAYGRPDWNIADGTAEAPESAVDATKTETLSISIPTLKQGDKGLMVKVMQVLLEGRGYRCGIFGADGDFGAASDKALRKYQAEKGLEIDGVCGPESWKSLFRN